MLIDSHCHLQPFDPDKLRITLEEARQAGVEGFIAVSANVNNSAQSVDLHSREDDVWAGIGIHPWQAVPVDHDVRDSLMALAEREGVVVIGEIGLDFERVTDPAAHEVQRQAIRAQLKLAQDLGLPISLHCKSAHAEMLALLNTEGAGVNGVIHSFAGNAQELDGWLERGFYVGVGYRALIRPGKEAALALTRRIPLDRLLLESDCSYRSAWGDDAEKIAPSNVRSVAEALAEDRGISVEQLEAATTANARRLLRLPSSD